VLSDKLPRLFNLFGSQRIFDFLRLRLDKDKQAKKAEKEFCFLGTHVGLLFLSWG
jgi:hypothetical protein